MATQKTGGTIETADASDVPKLAATPVTLGVVLAVATFLGAGIAFVYREVEKVEDRVAELDARLENMPEILTDRLEVRFGRTEAKVDRLEDHLLERRPPATGSAGQH